MSRIPPSLLYLTIYNPTLKPSNPIPDDEDAEEQAHILFYTGRERAVSRDRILRQVGLAKALINFARYAIRLNLHGRLVSSTLVCSMRTMSVRARIRNQDAW